MYVLGISCFYHDSAACLLQDGRLLAAARGRWNLDRARSATAAFWPTPDALLCFMRTHMDYLVMDRFLLGKKEMPKFKEEGDWRRLFELD